VIDATLDRVGILSRGDLPARSLSAGQKRRLSLARLLLADAALWIMDEPVTNLDTAGIALVEELIVEHAEQGGMVIAAAHQRLLDEAACLRRLELTP
jgi:heme exporter protein A